MQHDEKSELNVKVQNDSFKWNYILKNCLENETSLDLSQSSIQTIPKGFLLKFSNLQYFYLEGNMLTELDQELFPTLTCLRWLDVRNNKITTVPSTIVDHPSLEVLLLEGNRIENLPVEIGSLKSLRGLQLARNPIEFPPESVVNQGVGVTIEYLRRQWNQLQSPKLIELVSETHQSSQKTRPTAVKKQRTGGSKSAVLLRKVKSGKLVGGEGGGLGECISVRPLSRRRPNNLGNNRLTSWAPQEGFYSSYDTHPNIHNRNRSMSHDKIQSKRSEDVQPKFIRDLWLEKIRQVLLTQETILQRRKNAEALKQWQDEAKIMKRKIPEKDADVEINFPYDTDPTCLRMLSRKDLTTDGSLKRRDSSLHSTRHEVPINDRIVSIMEALRELQSSQAVVSRSPRSDQKALAEEIKKIKDIQRSLNALKLKNFGKLDLSS